MNYEKLKQYEPITILGHDNADNDSITSVYLMKKIFDFLNIESRIVIPDGKIPETFDYERYKFEYDTTLLDGQNLFLVDHDETLHNGNVVGYIDHHAKTLYETETKLNKPQSSCGKIIFDQMIDLGIKPDKDIYYLAVRSLYLDCVSFKSKKSIESDKIWANEICEQYKFDKNKLYTEGLMLTDISKITEKTILTDLKVFNINGNSVSTSCLKTADVPSAEKIQEIIDELKYQQNISGSDYWMLSIGAIEDNKTVVLLSDGENVIRTDFDGIKSRGKDLKPLLDKKIPQKNQIQSIDEKEQEK